MSISKRIAVLKELKSRQELAALPTFTFKEYAFPAQYEAFRSEGARFRTIVTSRRFGKSQGIAGDMLDTCLTEKDITCLYITLTRENVRKILWGDLLKTIEKYKIKCKINQLNLEIHFPNGSRILSGGAKDATECEKYRGLKLRKVYLDEAQSFRTHINILINDILIPALRDLRGSIYLVGTPGPVPVGAFYDYSHNENWVNVVSTAFSNPYLHCPEEGRDLNITLAEERKLRGIDENDPSYQREAFGRWIEDSESLVFKYNEATNDYVSLPQTSMTYIFGIDIGFNDSDAIAVLAYSDRTNEVYIVEEKEGTGQDITTLAEEIKKLQRKYNPVKMVIDAGALGKKIQEELIVRHCLHIEAADKSRKFEYIELLNADLRRGIVRAKRDSLFAQDCKLVTWDRSNREKLKVSSVYHSDIADAVLYAYRCCRHYVKQDAVVKYGTNSNEFMNELEIKDSANMKQQIEDPDMWEYGQILENENDDDFGF